jgi:hypothetical protein
MSGDVSPSLGGQLEQFTMTPLPVIAPSVLRSAGVAACSYARDRDDARLLLEAIGVLPTPPPPGPPPRELCPNCGYRPGARNCRKLCGPPPREYVR